jgi:AAA+ ATPase superfamily predicted ATPase
LFKRKIYSKLIEWKNESDGRTALLIEGARRIGKSTIVKEFAVNEYESYILIDFSSAPKTIHDLFDDISDLNYLFLQLQLQYHVDLIERKSLIIFDEVQFCPKARQAIKHLVQDHRYDYIETGSLISIRRNVKDILSLYEDDLQKIDPTGKAKLLFDAIPAQLNKNASRYQVSSVLENSRAGDLLQLIGEMKDSNRILQRYIIYTKDFSKDQDVICLPVYMSPFI